MNINTSPLESLAAFAIAFAAGVVTTAAVGIYTRCFTRPVSPAQD